MNFIIVGINKIDTIFLKEIIKNFPSLKLKGEFLKLDDAIKIIKSEKIHFLLLSSNLTESLTYSNEHFKNTEVVLITNKSFDAISSYTYGFIDCLLKPISIDRFKTTIIRIRKKLKESSLAKSNAKEKIVVKSNYKYQKIELNEIKWIEAMGDYVKIVTDKKEYIVLSTLKSFNKRLPEGLFFRIHKSFIINLNNVKNYSSNFINVNGKLIPISRDRKKDFKKIFLKYQ